MGIGTEELTVEHVGEPGKGVPIGLFVGGEGPAKSFEGQSPFHKGIFEDIAVVIEVNKFVPGGLGVHKNDYSR